MAKLGVRVNLGVVNPKGVDPKLVQKLIRQAVRQTVKYITKDLADVTGTWDHKPAWDITYGSIRSGNLVGGATTFQQIYRFLDDGTDEKWILLNIPYEDKTSPDSLVSGPGVRTYDLLGNYWRIRGKQAMSNAGYSAQKGIEKREFSIKIAKRALLVLDAGVNTALKQSGF